MTKRDWARFGMVFGICLTLGLLLPGVADKLSRQRDNVLERRIADLNDSSVPAVLKIVVPNSSYTCTLRDGAMLTYDCR